MPLQSYSKLKAGDIYLTTYGAAVVIDVNTNPNPNANAKTNADVSLFKAKLWRHPGKSVATAATATLSTTCVSDYLYLHRIHF